MVALVFNPSTPEAEAGRSKDYWLSKLARTLCETGGGGAGRLSPPISSWLFKEEEVRSREFDRVQLPCWLLDRRAMWWRCR